MPFGDSSAVSFVETLGARLAIFEEGSIEDAILLLHGGPGVPDYLADVSGILATKHRVIRFDQRGTGRSPCDSRRYALDDYVNDVEAVRRARNLERLKLLGHSWGGLVLSSTPRGIRIGSRSCACVIRASGSGATGKRWNGP